MNTFILLACLSLTGWWASGGRPLIVQKADWKVWLFGIGFIGVLILGMSGALTALGDTLFPVSNLEEGLREDFSTSAHFLVRLRILHPTIAILVSGYLFIIIKWITNRVKRSGNKNLGRFVLLLLIFQLLAGLINVILLAPVWMQLLHLLLSDLIWISLVLFAATSLSQENVELLEDPR